jgi:hypothetical protein
MEAMFFQRANAVQEEQRTAIFGSVDAFDPQVGLTGWCVDRGGAARELEVELLVNGVAFALTSATLPRADASEEMGMEGRFGFCFDPSVFDSFLENKTHFIGRPYALRVCGETGILTSSQPHEDFAALLDAREALLARGDGEVLIDSLARLREASETLLPCPPARAAEAGVIEAAAIGAGGLVWFIGWVAKKIPVEFSAVVLDKKRYPAGMRVVFYPRADLPEQAVGVVGVMLTDWRPSARGDALITFGDEAGGVLRVMRPLRLTTIADVLGKLEECVEPDSKALARLMDVLALECDGWELETAAARKIKLALDEAQFLEGFGVFLKGWVVSPSHRVKSMALKLGEVIAPCDASSLHFWPRPDLASGFPGMNAAFERAGFTGVFRGDLHSADFDNAALRLTFEDGKSTHHKLFETSFERIPSTSDLSELRKYYRVVEREPVFREIARAHYAAIGAEMRKVHGAQVRTCSSALVFCAPPERHLQFYLFERLLEFVAGADADGVGLVIVAHHASRHGEITEMFDEVAKRFSGPSSLVFVSDVDCALWSLSTILTIVDARRFVFVSAQIALTREGFAALGEMVGAGEDLSFFDVKDLAQDWAPQCAGAQAFSWSTSRWIAFARSTNLPIRAPLEAKRLGEGRRLAHGGEFMRKVELPRLIREINQVMAGGAR